MCYTLHLYNIYIQSKSSSSWLRHFGNMPKCLNQLCYGPVLLNDKTFGLCVYSIMHCYTFRLLQTQNELLGQQQLNNMVFLYQFQVLFLIYLLMKSKVYVEKSIQSQLKVVFNLLGCSLLILILIIWKKKEIDSKIRLSKNKNHKENKKKES